MLTIITPVLNGVDFLKDNIESIKLLEIPFEHIIVDGGSTDGSLEIVAQYPHIRLIHQKENTGIYGAIHQGIVLAKGKLLTWVNSDDRIIPKGYQLLYNEAIKKKADLVYGHGLYHFIEESKFKFIGALPFARFFLKQGVFPFIQSSSIFSKGAYLKVGGFNFSRFKIIGDRDLFQRMAYDESLKLLRVKCLASVFLRHSNSLLYSNLELLKKEHQYTIKTNQSFAIRFLYQFFRFTGRLSNLL